MYVMLCLRAQFRTRRVENNHNNNKFYQNIGKREIQKNCIKLHEIIENSLIITNHEVDVQWKMKLDNRHYSTMTAAN